MASVSLSLSVRPSVRLSVTLRCPMSIQNNLQNCEYSKGKLPISSLVGACNNVAYLMAVSGWHTVNKLAQETCTSLLRKFLASNFRGSSCKFLYKKTFTTNMADKADIDAAVAAVAVIAV